MEDFSIVGAAGFSRDSPSETSASVRIAPPPDSQRRRFRRRRISGETGVSIALRRSVRSEMMAIQSMHDGQRLADNLAVKQVDRALRVASITFVMGYQANRRALRMQFAKQIH